MNNILWVSRHAPLESQVKELKRMYGSSTSIIIEAKWSFSAEWIVRRFKELQARDLVLVAPLSCIKKVIELGVFPLHAVMQKVDPDDPRAEVSPNHLLDKMSGQTRVYRFIKFKRYRRFDIELEDVKPQGESK